MIEDWIDAVAAVWEIKLGSFKTVRSFYLMRDADFPESIDVHELAEHPVALTFWPSLEPQYSAGGPKIAFWSGETEIHLCADFKKSRAREMLPWYKFAWAAAAADPTLGGKVELFTIPARSDAVVLTSLQYGEEAVHWGLVVQWLVKEHVDAQIVVGG